MNTPSDTTHKADILIVDDTPDNLRILSQMLILFGYRVRAVTEGALALSVLQNAIPDLIMLDINMPVMDGYETCRRIKADERWRSIPIIFISAMGEVEEKLKAFRAGGVDYITKPFHIEEVLARIDTHVSIRQLQSQLQAANHELAQRLDELSQARAHEYEQRRLAETMRDTISAINQTLNYDEVLDLILDNLARVLPYDTASIMLLSEEKCIQVARARGYEKFGLESLVSLYDQPVENYPVWQQMLEQRTTRVAPYAQQETLWPGQEQLSWVRSAIYAPIQTCTDLLGFLNLESSTAGFFTEEQGERLQIFADQAAVAIEKARLFQETQRLATLDSLTGLSNRRQLLLQAQEEYARARRYQRPLSALMIDLDHFKAINDRFGHPVGDQALKGVASCLRMSLRNTDIYGRYGGEEFLILLPESETPAAIEAAERIRQVVQQLVIETDHGAPKVTISGGLATLLPGQATSLDDLIRNADDALYAAKAAGRNQILAYSPNLT